MAAARSTRPPRASCSTVARRRNLRTASLRGIEVRWPIYPPVWIPSPPRSCLNFVKAWSKCGWRFRSPSPAGGQPPPVATPPAPVGALGRSRFQFMSGIPAGDFLIVTLNVNGARLFPSMKVHKRLTEGSGEDIWNFYQSVRAKLQAQPGAKVQ